MHNIESLHRGLKIYRVQEVGRIMEKNNGESGSNTSMKKVLQINLGWSLLMLVWLAYLVLGRYSFLRGVMIALAVIYAIIAILALRQRRWAIVASVIVAAILMIRWLPMVAVNFLMFITRNELYRGSPATILVVAAYALVFAFPATLLCTLFFVKRRDLRLMLQSGRPDRA